MDIMKKDVTKVLPVLNKQRYSMVKFRFYIYQKADFKNSLQAHYCKYLKMFLRNDKIVLKTKM